MEGLPDPFSLPKHKRKKVFWPLKTNPIIIHKKFKEFEMALFEIFMIKVFSSLFFP